MHKHVTAFRQGMEKLNTMGDEYKIPNRDFALLLITPLPKPWDSSTTPYFGSKANSKAMSITSSELIKLLISEDGQRHAKSTDNEVANAMHIHKFNKKGRKHSNGPTCSNCGWLGHTIQDCWSKGEEKKVKTRNKRRKTSPRLSLQIKQLCPIYLIWLIW